MARLISDSRYLFFINYEIIILKIIITGIINSKIIISKNIISEIINQ